MHDNINKLLIKLHQYAQPKTNDSVKKQHAVNKIVVYECPQLLQYLTKTAPRKVEQIKLDWYQNVTNEYA